jgi:hypothetical protein
MDIKADFGGGRDEPRAAGEGRVLCVGGMCIGGGGKVTVALEIIEDCVPGF